MFNNPLSFNGRIGRLEYFFSFLLYWVIAIGILIMANEENSTILAFVKIIISVFFVAQGAKRCHDIGRSGWFQLVPFFFMWMLLSRGKPENNYYGTNDRGNNKSSTASWSSPLAESVFSIIGILILFFTVAIVLGLIELQNKTNFVLGGFLSGGIFLLPTIWNNFNKKENTSINTDFHKNNEDEAIEPIQYKDLTASQLIDKYKSKSHD